MPIGTVITWPSEGNPTYGGEWLECNGQEVPSKYTALRKLMTRVPDYRGMFLRGYGSQSFSQDLGYLNPNTSTTYSSGSIGQIQGDAMRPMGGGSPALFFTPGYGDTFVHYSASNMDYYMRADADKRSTIMAFGRPKDDNFLTGQGYWVLGKQPWHYRYTVETSTTGEGEDAQTSYSLIETKEPMVADQVDGAFLGLSCFYGIEINNAYCMPLADELRPVNVAVRFFIKAR